MPPSKPKVKAAASSPSADAAKDVLAAMKAGDATALDLALTRHYESCSSEPDEDDTDEEV